MNLRNILLLTVQEFRIANLRYKQTVGWHIVANEYK
jgi:hypothetical protein